VLRVIFDFDTGIGLTLWDSYHTQNAIGITINEIKKLWKFKEKKLFFGRKNSVFGDGTKLGEKVYI
jgi:hypothetical protein